MKKEIEVLKTNEDYVYRSGILYYIGIRVRHGKIHYLDADEVIIEKGDVVFIYDTSSGITVIECYKTPPKKNKLRLIDCLDIDEKDCDYLRVIGWVTILEIPSAVLLLDRNERAIINKLIKSAQEEDAEKKSE